MALLFKRDDNYTTSGVVSSPLGAPHVSWVEIFDSAGTHLKYWPVGYESTYLVAVTGASADTYEFAVGAGGKTSVIYVPASTSGSTLEVPVGTSSEFLVLPSKYPNKVLALSRLGGSRLVVMPRSGAAGTHHGKDQVGPWPCGMAQSQSGKYLYVLSHFDNTVRVLDIDKLATTSYNNVAASLLASHKLPGRTVTTGSGSFTLDYQLTDSLSLMASSADGKLHVALLNELGSVRIFRTAGTALKVVHQDDPLTVEPDLGTGRMVGAAGTCGSQDSVFVYERQTNLLRHYTKGSSGWALPTTVTVPAYFGSGTADYKRSSMHFDPNTCLLYVYDVIYDVSSGTMNFARYLHTTASSSSATPVAYRVIATGSAGRIFGQVLGGGNERLVEVALSGSGYTTTASDTLFTYDTIKSGTAMREADGGWEGVYSEAYLGKVHWWTNIW